MVLNIIIRKKRSRETIYGSRIRRIDVYKRQHKDLADLSLKLARICIDAPIEFSMADAKLENLYTPEAYEYMKRLELSLIHI